MGWVCVGNHAGRTSDPPLSIHPPHRARQENIVASDALAPHWAGGVVCSGESGELCFYPRRYGEGDNGDDFRFDLDWTADVASFITTIGVAFLAGSVIFLE